jgi:hypothetical protein
MSLKTFIADVATNLKAKVDNDNGLEDGALVVATRPLKTYTNRLEFFSNPTYGIDMNQALPTGGTPIYIHDGIDNIYWTASGIVGAIRWDFNSTDEAHTGTHSIDATPTINGDEAQFAKGSPRDLTGFTALSGWIYITGWPTLGIKEAEIYGWDTTSSTQIGSSINIGAYVNTATFNIWQKFVIPLTVMGLTDATIDAVRVRTVSTGGGVAPAYYLDDLEIQEDELPLEYIIEPPHDTWIWVDQINVVMADVLDTTLLSSSMHNLSYDKFLALPALPVGLFFQRYNKGEVILTATFRYLLDFLQLPNTNILNVGCDGANTWFSLNQIFASPILLKASEQDKLVFSVRDDMSGLLIFRISASSKQEDRSGRSVQL